MVKDEDLAPVVLKCPRANCKLGADGAKYKTPELEGTIAMEMLKLHHANHAVPVPVGNDQQQVRPEKIRRPQLVVKEGSVTEEAFEYFEHAWEEYKPMASVTTAVKQHLSSCLGEEVTTMIHATHGTAGYKALTEASLMAAAKGIVVNTRNKLVMELQLKKIVQGPDQPVLSYLANLKPIARNCKFQVKGL